MLYDNIQFLFLLILFYIITNLYYYYFILLLIYVNYFIIKHKHKCKSNYVSKNKLLYYYILYEWIYKFRWL